MTGKAAALILQGLSPATKKLYKRAWLQFSEFTIANYGNSPVICMQELLTRFILHKHDQGYAYCSIQTQISAINFLFKLSNCPSPSNSFLVRKILKGIAFTSSRPDGRLPITRKILLRLCNAMDHLMEPYKSTMLKTMFSLAFHAFLRVGEMTSSSNNIQRTQVQVFSKSIQLAMLKFKHAPLHNKTVLLVKHTLGPDCPVQLLKQYLLLRPVMEGPLFIFVDGKPVPKHFFNNSLKIGLEFLEISYNKYTSHSFRIGAATYAAEKGLSEDQIMRMGRWKSKAFRKYIRIPVLHT